MRNKILFLFLLSLSIVSCSKEDMDSSDILYGQYTETPPIDGRTTLSFLRGNIMIETDNRDGHSDSFHNILKDSILVITPSWDGSQSYELNIKIISPTKFEIENLYIGIPEIDYPDMVFKKL